MQGFVWNWRIAFVELPLPLAPSPKGRGGKEARPRYESGPWHILCSASICPATDSGSSTFIHLRPDRSGLRQTGPRLLRRCFFNPRPRCCSLRSSPSICGSSAVVAVPTAYSLRSTACRPHSTAIVTVSRLGLPRWTVPSSSFFTSQSSDGSCTTTVSSDLPSDTVTASSMFSGTPRNVLTLSEP